jgi:uncharacterized protein YggT (Ycf19 family)
LRLILLVINLVALVLVYVTLAAVGLLVLRVIVAWVGSNPFGWLPYNLRRATEPMVRPLRHPFAGYYMRFDLMPLVAAALILMLGLFTANLLWRFSGLAEAITLTIQYGVMTGRFIARWSVLLAGTLYETAIFLRFLLPWLGIGYSSQLMRFMFKITEPLLKVLRRALGRFVSISVFDFTPVIALLLVRFATELVADLLR